MTATSPPLPDWNHVLAAVPVRNAAVRAEQPASGQLLLKLPLRKTWFTKPPWSWLLPLSPYRKFLLDELGAEIWKSCDGVRRTEEIIVAFADRHRLSFHEARLAVGQFIGMMMARKLIALTGSPGQQGGPP